MEQEHKIGNRHNIVIEINWNRLLCIVNRSEMEEEDNNNNTREDVYYVMYKWS